MAAAQDHINDATPMGATLVDGGATFRVWAPGALEVHVALGGIENFVPSAADALIRNAANSHWTGFFPGVQDGSKYCFWVRGPGGSGAKRDPRARELEPNSVQDTDCIVRARDSYPWHDHGFAPPHFNDLVVYQLHIGVFRAVDAAGSDRRLGRVSKYLDAIERVHYLADLGVNAIQPLLFVEFWTTSSQGYNGTDIFSPERDYGVPTGELAFYVDRVNALLANKGAGPVTAAQLTGPVNQLKAFIDVCHLYGLAVLPDVVYNHAGAGEMDNQSLDFFDLPAHPDGANSIYFSTARHVGKVFRYDQPEVSAFLIDNARMFLGEYHVDGFRFDQVTVMAENGGWWFCQDLTNTLRYIKPSAVLIAEFWGNRADRWKAVTPPEPGLGFDIGYDDGLRDAVRDVLSQAAGGADASVDMARLRDGLWRPFGVPQAWRVYNCIENHDLVLDADGDHRQPRIPQRADWDNHRSPLACGRSRVATGFLLTAPGVPMVFMGQEFLADRWWSDDPNKGDLLIRWADLAGGDPQAADFHQFCTDMIRLRLRHPALRSEPVNAFHADNYNRVFAFHRWVPGLGRDVVVVVSLREAPFADGGYVLGFPQPGRWHEVFNSDLYDHFPGHSTQHNHGGVDAGGAPMHGMSQSAGVTIPSNSILVFGRDHGD